MAWLASIALKFFSGGALSFVSNILTQLTNTHVAIVQAQTGLEATEAAAVVNAEIARQGYLSSTIVAGMNHPIWWIGWGLFVFPAGLYSAQVHFKSVFCAWGWFDACSWNILEIPRQFESWDTYVVLSFFGLAATSSVVAAIAKRATSTPRG